MLLMSITTCVHPRHSPGYLGLNSLARVITKLLYAATRYRPLTVAGKSAVPVLRVMEAHVGRFAPR